MANASHPLEGDDLPGPGRGFLVRDLLRFFVVDMILIVSLRLLLGLGMFPSLDIYVCAVLASKLVLLGYLVWLVRDRRESWPQTGALTAGRWWAWPASLALYVACHPLLVRANQFNHTLMEQVYDWLDMPYTRSPQEVMALIFSDALAAPTLVGLILFTVVIGPLMEELAFRGIGLDAFRRRQGVVLAVLWTSLLFGLFHFSLQLIIPLSLMGVLFAAVRLLSGSLWACLAIHSLHNALSLIITAYELKLFTIPWT